LDVAIRDVVDLGSGIRPFLANPFTENFFGKFQQRSSALELFTAKSNETVLE